jgi:hypothetical protein
LAFISVCFPVGVWVAVKVPVKNIPATTGSAINMVRFIGMTSGSISKGLKTTAQWQASPDPNGIACFSNREPATTIRMDPCRRI